MAIKMKSSITENQIDKFCMEIADKIFEEKKQELIESYKKGKLDYNSEIGFIYCCVENKHIELIEIDKLVFTSFFIPQKDFDAFVKLKANGELTIIYLVESVPDQMFVMFDLGLRKIIFSTEFK